MGETWRHADEQTPARPLPLRVETMPETEILVVVDEGDNAPLPLTKARLLLPSYRLRFFTPVSRCRGWRTAETIFSRRSTTSRCSRRASWAPWHGDQCGTGSERHTIFAAASFASPKTFWVVLAGAVLVLLALIVRLIRGQGEQAES